MESLRFPIIGTGEGVDAVGALGIRSGEVYGFTASGEPCLHVICLVEALEYPSKTTVASLFYLPKKSVFWFEIYLKVDPITHGHHLKFTLY